MEQEDQIDVSMTNFESLKWDQRGYKLTSIYTVS